MFHFLSLAIAVICLVKAGVALSAPQVFYRFRRRQYASSAVPLEVLVMPSLVVVLTLLAWYATLTQAVAYGWLVTGFLSLFAVMGCLNLLRWTKHRQTLLISIQENSSKRGQVDWSILLIGMVYLILGLFVY